MHWYSMLWTFSILYHVAAQTRLCEIDGTCRHCLDNHFSYYRCRTQTDCYMNEVCDRGFCCPSTGSQYHSFNQQKGNHEDQLFNSEDRPVNLMKSIEKDERCPDGSSWTRRCYRDEDCSFGEELCTEGKCCLTCALRRRKVLDNMRAQELLGLQIPQCDDDNDQFYRKKQCLAGTTKCWCVSNFGRKLIGANDDCEIARRRQENLLVKAQNLLKESTVFEKNTTKCYGIRAGICPRTPEFSRMNSQSSGGVPCRCDSDCYDNNKCCTGLGRTNNLAESETQRFCMKPVTPSGLSMVCGANEQFSACYSPCQPFCEDPTVTACPPPVCQPGCHCQPGYIRRDGSPKSACVPRQMCETYDLSAKCADPRRQYHSCGSACPVSCDNRNQPRCGEHCVAGCFCKLPYILLDDENPLTSRCILPAECPVSQTQAPSIHYLARHPVQMPVFPSIPQYPYTGVSPNQNIHYGGGYLIGPPTQSTVPPKPAYQLTTSTISPTLIPYPENPEHHCTDPLKNFLTCGNNCPPSCTPNELLNCTSKECGPPRCYCRLPYILSDGKDPDSACVLPQLCPRFKEESSFIPETTTKTPSKTLEEKCNDPKKMWTSCGAQGCARSCVNPLGRCSEGQCYEGCICKEPYVIQDSKDPESPCLLPSECENHCDDPLKEFVKCASSCPMGCDNRHPKHCTPCEDGCFCKNGLVFINSTDWKNSECIRLDECPTEQAKSSEKAEPEFKFKLPTGSPEMPAVKTSTFLKMDNNETKDETDSIAKFTAKQLPRPTKCPATTYDVGGRPCVDDSDCPVEQLCCKPKIVRLGVTSQRCTCPDPNAIWKPCGTSCPEYCGQPSVPVCAPTCNPGCECAPGFVRSRNDVTAPCVPAEQCDLQRSPSHDEAQFSKATIKELPPKDPFQDRQIAAAVLVSPDSSVTGRFTFSEITSSTTKIEGQLYGMSPGQHAVVLHNFGDASEGCSRIGDPFSLTSTSQSNPSLGDVDGSSTGIFTRVVDFPVHKVIGRAIAIYKYPTSEWSDHDRSEKPVACGTIGLSHYQS